MTFKPTIFFADFCMSFSGVFCAVPWCLCAGLPSSVRLCFGQPCSPCESGRFRRPSPHSPSLSLRVDSCTARVTDKRRLPAYTYTPSGASPAVIVSLSKVPPGIGPKQSRAWHPRELGQGDAYSSLASGKSSTPPARCIHHSRHDASSAGYRLLASFAPGVARATGSDMVTTVNYHSSGSL